MQVTAKARGYYGGGIKEIGETFNIAKPEHLGSWMQPGKELPEAVEQKYTGYVAARGAAGKFVVKDAAGQMVGAFTGNKAEAEAEADRLNAGGELNPPPASDAPPPGGGDQDDDNGPDA
ncbi:hypothetical protein [Pseudomonas sp. Au-Pse12]|uniref:hypothetical protein n=1 Tax=Pseudomonas sp. Au-Pse12 TaxID=2906459 RepID=UPI001E4E43B3|nr:hypothetical protein [Pseudomonas sp. Au-Pse12]MCE4056299.1 hypothetical protein [Pseudomonas sp. Au-Pse12]